MEDYFLVKVNSRGVTVHIFVPSRHGTGTSVRLQRCTAVCKCGVHSVNMANVNACFVVQNIKLAEFPPDRLALGSACMCAVAASATCVWIDG